MRTYPQIVARGESLTFAYLFGGLHHYTTALKEDFNHALLGKEPRRQEASMQESRSAVGTTINSSDGDGDEMRQIARLKATGLRFINGVASSYDERYPEALDGLLSPRDFDEAINHLNNIILMYWPCNTCFFFGYVCSFCSFGLSFGCPNVCIAAAEKNARGELEYLNRTAPFREVGMIWRLKKTCLSSWIIIEVPAEKLALKQKQKEQQEQNVLS